MSGELFAQHVSSVATMGRSLSSSCPPRTRSSEERHTATKERRADRAAGTWRSTARLPPGGLKSPVESHLVGARAGQRRPRDVRKRLDPFRPERDRGHPQRTCRGGHHCSSFRFTRGIGFSRSTVLPARGRAAASAAEDRRAASRNGDWVAKLSGSEAREFHFGLSWSDILTWPMRKGDSRL